MLKKVEELTLYVISQHKEIKLAKERHEELLGMVCRQEKEINELKRNRQEP